MVSNRLGRILSSRRAGRLREIGGFVLAGTAAVLLDLATFTSLSAFGFNSSVANVVSTSIGLIANFIINYRTFVAQGRSIARMRVALIRFSLVLSLSFAYLLLGFELFLRVAPESSLLVLTFVRILLIGSGTLLRFFIFRHWVFFSKEHTK